MAILHLCAACGHNLGREHIRPDARWALPVVVCPGCGAACVRRVHPLVRAGRRARRAAFAVGALAIQLVVGGILLLVGSALCAAVSEDPQLGVAEALLAGGADPDVLPPWKEHPELVIGWLASAGAAGVWLAACLPHWRRWAALVGWVGLMFGALTLGFYAEAGNRAAWRVASMGQALGTLAPVWAESLGNVLLSAPAVLVGVPIGTRLGGVWATMRQRAWRRLWTRERHQRALRSA